MVKLDYRTNNPRWGLKGVQFDNWADYAYILGYLSNPAHYKNLNPYGANAKISVHIEGNNEQGAWDKEGRIHFYGKEDYLQLHLEPLYNCCSAGNGTITKRINSNGYILSLINDYGFTTKMYMGYTTAEVFPPDVAIVEAELRRHLSLKRFTANEIDSCMNDFYQGYNL